eukprot:g1156.t1
MCGIIAVLLADPDAPACQLLYDGLTMLQHRGQDAAGIVTCDTRNRQLHMRKSNGLVKEVFQTEHMVRLVGNMGISHCRYPTAGSSSSAEAQPFYTNTPFGLCLAHNGNLTNGSELLHELREISMRHCNTTSDSEALLNLFAHELAARVSRDQASAAAAAKEGDGGKRERSTHDVRAEQVFDTVDEVCRRCVGGYAAVVLINGVGIVGFRDPWGIRPLAIGWRARDGSEAARDWALASESVAMDVLDFTLDRDIQPGEAVFIPCHAPSPDGSASPPPPRPIFRRFAGGAGGAAGPSPTLSPCLFEYVYFARPDSVLDGVSVYQARLNMGRTLARRIKKVWGGAEAGAPEPEEAAAGGARSPFRGPGGLQIDVVVPIPDTSRTSALALANELGVPYQEGLIKNRYIARTFIMPGQPIRRSAVRLKLNAIKSEIAGRHVLLVDDSIVRGTTATKIVELTRAAGAKSVHFVSAAPKILHPNVYGIDMPCREELVAHNRTDADVARKIGADRVLYQELSDLEEAVRAADEGSRIARFESSVFSGEYVTGGVTDAYLDNLAAMRNDSAKRGGLAKGKGGPSLAAVSMSKQAAMATAALGSMMAGSSDALDMFNLRTVKEV